MPLDNITHADDGTGSHDPFRKYNTEASPILFKVAERHVGWLNIRSNNYERVPTHKALVRVAPSGDAALVLAVVGSNYKLVHNSELFSRVEDTLCKKMQSHELDGVTVTDKVASHGRMCYRQYVFPNIKCNIGGGARSDIAFRLIVQNGYGDSALRMHAGAIEFYCSNGMIRGEYESVYRRHTSGLVVSGISESVDKALTTFANSQNVWREWARKPVRNMDAMELFRELARTDRLTEKLNDHYMHERDARGENLWAVYSTLTYYASHNDGEFRIRDTGMDTVAVTMLERELRVAKWVNSNAWQKLEHT